MIRFIFLLLAVFSINSCFAYEQLVVQKSLATEFMVNMQLKGRKIKETQNLDYSPDGYVLIIFE